LPLELALIVDTAFVSTQEQVTKAVVEFADAADLSDLSLSLQLLPLPTALDQCDFDNYLTPFVPMTPVPLVADDLRAAFASARYTYGRNAPRPALAGTLMYLRQRQDASPLIQHAALLVLDHLELYCDTSANSVASVAAAALAEEPSILTAVYAPSSGGPIPELDLVAAAGGTRAASYAELAPDAGAPWEGLVDGLRRIRKQATACSFAMPVSEEGAIDPQRVRVLFQESPSLPERSLPLLDSLAGCTGGRDGFYYDNPADPRVLRLCPASCAISRSAAAQAELTVVAECVVVLE